MDEILPRRRFVYGATILDKIDGKLKHPLPSSPKSTDGTGKRGRSGLRSALSSIRGDGITYYMMRCKIVAIYDYILCF